MYRVETMFGDYNVEIRTARYSNNGNLAIELFEPEEGPFARLTVNLGKKLSDECAYLDTNNCPWAESFVEENKLGEPTGDFGFSGYCVYPMYKFNMERLRMSEYWVFLENLRRSGVTNMFGAVPYLVEAFGLDEYEARNVLVDWMKNYNPEDYKDWD